MSLSLSNMYGTKMGKHRKWQEIMVLEVQDAGEGLHHLSSMDVQWTPICVDNNSTTDLCVAIPLGRLDAFIKGESLCEGVETKFLRKRQSEHDSFVHNTHTTKMPDVAILVLKQPLHVDKNGEACHGMDDTSSELRSQFAPNLSDECKAYIERLLLMDVSIDAIMDRHLDDLIFHDMLKKRDSFVTRKDVINATMRPEGADRPFIMGIQMSWMLDMMVQFSHDSIISMDSTFATNKYRRRAKEKRPDWRINAFIMDDASA
ncbi:hypothetical protein SUGI_0984280 [Cryptomeria japonica]|nr:hypothetical protein SUGI_0984280 [Cryptomeria japonica]